MAGLRIYCDKDKVNKLLDGRKIPWLVDKLNEVGIAIEYKALVQLLNNRNDWKLVYAVGMCQVLNSKIGNLFYFMDTEGNRLNINFL